MNKQELFHILEAAIDSQMDTFFNKWIPEKWCFDPHNLDDVEENHKIANPDYLDGWRDCAKSLFGAYKVFNEEDIP